MTPLLLFTTSSVKKYVVMAVASVMVLFSLPIMALFAITNVAALGSGGDSSGTYLYTDPAAAGDLYDYGYCTYWSALRRAQIGEPIPQNWGDAITWAVNALLVGYRVNHNPSFGAIMQNPNAPGGLGHVAFVESVDPDTGAWTISEMNAVGWDEVDQRTFPASAAKYYNFIHEPLQQ